MPRYNSKQKVKSGMPLGGIGAGKWEITPYGTLDYISYQNNWTQPIFNCSNLKQQKAQGLAGFHFAVYVNSQAAVICKLLQTEKIQNYSTVTQIEFDAKFPYAYLNYKDRNLPVKISCCVNSFLIPADVKNSSLPGCVFEFEVTNPLPKNVDVGIMCIARNLTSKNSVGRINSLKKTGNLIGLEFSHSKPLACDTQAGDTFLGVSRKSGKISFLTGWNMQKDNFCFEPNVGLDAFEYFEKSGRLPNTHMRIPVQSQSFELGGALAVNFKLASGQTRKVPFYYTWHFPRHFQGHLYEKSFRKSKDVAVYIDKNINFLQARTEQLPSIIRNMEIDDWLSDALISNLYPLFSSSWLTRNNDFTMYESPLICPLMGTLDVYFYASVAIGLLYPELDKKALQLFKKNIRKNGYMPHDLGLDRIDLPSNGTTSVLWKDLNPKFILLVYRSFLFSGDAKFLKDMYPVLKKVFEFSIKSDKNNDALPDNEGYDTTFDTWGFVGTSSYNSSIFLVSLLALKKIADHFNDKNLSRKCLHYFLKGQKSFEDKLWNGKFYIAAHNQNKLYESCTVAQIFGQWYAYLLGLGRVFPEDNIKSAINWIFKLNDKDSLYGATNSVFINKKRDKESYHSQNIWPGVCYAFAALAIYEGFEKQALKLTKKVWDTISKKNKNPWNQSDVIIAQDGSFGFGDYYMRNLVIWSILLALAKYNPKVELGIEKIKILVNSTHKI